jgi:hypothetical protein
MSTKLFLFILFNCILAHNAKGQVIESNSNRERNFVFEVKQIDEFIERFNNDNDGFLVNYIKRNYDDIKIDRKALIANLFNRKVSIWKKNDLDEFSGFVTNEAKPLYLDFDADNWYAEALSRFLYNGKVIDVVIILRIKKEQNGGTKWMIVCAYSKMIACTKRPANYRIRNNYSKFLSSMSHATNFISLSSALSDMSNIHDYLDDNFLRSPSSQGFLTALLSKKLRFQYVRKIKYHFLQVDNWIFTVERFQRESVNSGWLISNLYKASDKDKKAYTQALLKSDL